MFIHPIKVEFRLLIYAATSLQWVKWIGYSLFHTGSKDRHCPSFSVASMYKIVILLFYSSFSLRWHMTYWRYRLISKQSVIGVCNGRIDVVSVMKQTMVHITLIIMDYTNTGRVPFYTKWTIVLIAMSGDWHLAKSCISSCHYFPPDAPASSAAFFSAALTCFNLITSASLMNDKKKKSLRWQIS